MRPEAERWEAAFVAVSAIAGEPPEAVASALGVARAADLVRALGAASKEARARALARVLSDVALAIDAMRYA
jgi:hypothetical protein